MRVCITSSGRDLKSDCDPRFGRCSCFIFADSESGEFEVFNNPAVSEEGAGVKAHHGMHK